MTQDSTNEPPPKVLTTDEKKQVLELIKAPQYRHALGKPATIATIEESIQRIAEIAELLRLR
jgi:hypothetical protein